MTGAHGPLDPFILQTVHTVANRFGVSGLEELIGEAQRELAEARAALAGLTDDD